MSDVFYYRVVTYRKSTGKLCQELSCDSFGSIEELKNGDTFEIMDSELGNYSLYGKLKVISVCAGLEIKSNEPETILICLCEYELPKGYVQPEHRGIHALPSGKK